MKVFSSMLVSAAVLTLFTSTAYAGKQASATVAPAGDSDSGSTDSGSSSSTTTTSTTTTTTSTSSGSGSAANDFMSTLTSTGATSGDSYHMTAVHVVQARVQSDEPAWNEEGQRFVSKYYDDLTDAFVGVMDTVNTASVEGSLMYVQAEGINYNTRSSEERCTRKNEMTYVVFYEMAIVQTNETLALYEDTADQNEYGPMIPMDSGRCTPSDSSGSSETFPTACYYFNGDNGEPDIGPFVGGETKATDARAPYPNNVWYSFPNTCPLETWSDKTDSCRNSTRKGLCDMDVMPDGVTCTFNYRILGYIPIDDLVGITSMVSNTTGETYANFSEFCEDGGVEFEATTAGVWEESIDFWLDPQDEDANVARYKKLVAAYANFTSGTATSNQITDGNQDHFLPLPSIDDLVTENPPCYLNVKKCNTEYGCKRELYGQTCTVCNTTDSACVAPPSDWTFPTLEKAVGSNGGTGEAEGSSSTSGSSDGTSGGTSSAAPGLAMVTPATLIVTSSLTLLLSLLVN